MLPNCSSVSEWELRDQREAGEPALRVTPTASMAAEGRRLAHVNGCYGCHGDNLAGHLFIDRFYIGRLSAPSLTRIMPHYSDQQIADVIRAGVRADGTGVVFMPSHALVRLADADVAAMIAHFRTLEPRSGLKDLRDNEVAALHAYLSAPDAAPARP